MKSLLSISILVLALCGCETYRYEYAPSVSGVPQVKRRYALRKCESFYFFTTGEGRRERPDTLPANLFEEEDLRDMERLCPEVFADGGIPVSVKISLDWDRSESYAWLGLLDGMLYLGTAGIVPMVDAHENLMEVELEIGGGSASKSKFEMRESKRQTFSSSGLNLLFPYDPPSGRDYSQAGKAYVWTDGERRSWSIGMGVDRRCRKRAYAHAIAVALSEYERRQAESAKQDIIKVEQIPL